MNINTGREFPFPNSQDDGPGHPSPSGRRSSDNGDRGVFGRGPGSQLVRGVFYNGGGGGHFGRGDGWQRVIDSPREQPVYQVQESPVVDPPLKREPIGLWVCENLSAFVYLDRVPADPQKIRLFVGSTLQTLQQQEVSSVMAEPLNVKVLTKDNKLFQNDPSPTFNGLSLLEVGGSFQDRLKVQTISPKCQLCSQRTVFKFHGLDNQRCDKCRQRLRGVHQFFRCPSHDYDVCQRCAEGD